MEETKEKQSWAVYNEVEMEINSSTGNAKPAWIVREHIYKREIEYDERIKRLEADKEFLDRVNNMLDRANNLNWLRVKDLEAEKESLLVLNKGMLGEPRYVDIKRIKELEENNEFNLRERAHNWERYRKAERRIMELEAKNEWLGNYAMGKAVETVNDGLKMYELEDWQEEYGWTAHIFDSLDSNPLLGCKKWMA